MTSVLHQQKAKDNERTTKDKKRKAPTRKNTHERLTVKGFTLEAKIKYHVLTCKARVSTKLVRIRQKSRAEPPTGNAALYKGRSLSSLKASPAWYALRAGGRETISSKMPTSAIAILTYAHYSKSFKHFRTCYGRN